MAAGDRTEAAGALGGVAQLHATHGGYGGHMGMEMDMGMEMEMDMGMDMMALPYLHAHREQLVAHLAVPELVRQWPRRLT